MDTDWSARVAREFHREPLTPRRAIVLADVALEQRRRNDAERLVAIAFELYDIALSKEEDGGR